jgi:hypothetical protein
MANERQSYLADVELRDENRDSGGSIWWRWAEKMSGSPSSKRIVVGVGPDVVESRERKGEGKEGVID